MRCAQKSMTISTLQLITCIIMGVTTVRDYYYFISCFVGSWMQSSQRMASECAGACSLSLYPHLVRVCYAAPTHIVYINRTAIKQLYRCRRAVADLVLGSSLAHISSAVHIRLVAVAVTALAAAVVHFQCNSPFITIIIITLSFFCCF